MLLVHLLTMILLRLNDVAAKHLRILDFNLRIVENIIIVIDILYNLNRLVSFFFLWLGGSTSSSMGPVHWTTNRLGRAKVILKWIGEVLLKTC